MDVNDIKVEAPKYEPMSEEHLDVAREKMCRWIYRSASPFTVAEDPYFRAFLKMLHPGFVPPTRLDIANKYLDREQTRLQTKIDAVPHICSILDQHFFTYCTCICLVGCVCSFFATSSIARLLWMEPKMAEKKA